ncbi:EH signature domain-containing protein [Paralimibaculum aggregatum]|uniref:EH signature domain-containing protein n=1 Tax=Paralimibaculum aggregatum TaxID=3036245 RepID=A0ABQ6LS48_9RHOB|nr:EH signature domain-containing protein [Limibaculum sp. NKW23]GMG84561.1 EH signature domain-containing protein [Limibaculum sp. NKW23]
MTPLGRFARLASLAPPALPALNHLDRSVRAVLQRWPDALPEVSERNREAIVMAFRERFETGTWENTRLSFVTRAARVLFEPDFRDRPEFGSLRRFCIDEVRASTRAGFLNPMFSIYLASYLPGAAHTRALATALAEARPRLGTRWKRLFESFPRVLDPVEAPEDIARVMINMARPWAELKALGIVSPHGPGLMQHAHLAYLRLLRPHLREPERIERLLGWLKPEGQSALASGATEAIEALLEPWLTDYPPEAVRDLLVERLLSIYGDPRLPSANHWAGVGKAPKALMLRWLTRADMQFFMGVVTATQDSHMWPPRRDFWMKLYEQGRIDAAWVAFCPSAAEYARKHLMREEGPSNGMRFGRQTARANRANTSLLVMKIGRKIVIDGCHNYKTHIFDESEEACPQLFRSSYDCEKVRFSSTRSRSHSPYPAWERWVMMNI